MVEAALMWVSFHETLLKYLGASSLIALFLTLIPVGALIYAVVAAVDSYHHRDFQYWLVGEWLRDTLTD